MGRTHVSPPEPSPVRPFRVPDIASLDRAGGMAFRVAPRSRFPLVSVVLVLDAGEGAVPAERSGHASLTAASLQGGTERHTGAELAEALESIGASLAVRPGWDSTRVSLEVLADRLDEALDLFTDVVRRPSFPEEEVARVRSQRLAAIEQALAQPSVLADRSAMRFMYADGDPYGRPRGGTTESVEQFDADSARAHVAATFGPDIGVAAAGDLDPTELREQIETRFSEWGTPRTRSAPPASSPRSTGRRVYVVSRPGAVQSEIRIGHPGVDRAHPDFFPLRIFNATLGGTFTSRLNLNLREENGFTYGVRSRFMFRRGRGPFMISTAVETAVTAAAVREAMSEMEMLVAGGPSADEVESVRDYMAGVFPLQMETTGQIAGQLASMLVHDLPLDYFATYRDHIRAVTAEQATRAGQENVHPEQAAIVVVGDPEQVVPDLEALGLGPVTVEEPA